MKAVLGDWQITGLVQAQTGRPLTILSGSDKSGTAIGLDRAKVVGPAYGPGTCAGATKPCKEWLALTGFATNDAGTFGDAGKGAFRFPGLFLWDMGVTKNFAVTENFKIQLRGEFFQYFNHVNFDESIAAGNFAKLSTGKGTFGALTLLSIRGLGRLASSSSFS